MRLVLAAVTTALVSFQAAPGQAPLTLISTIDLRRMAQFHKDNQALATLAVQDRRTSRPLAFDEHLQLRGRGPGLAFSGIHVISPGLLSMLAEEGAFSIIHSYVRLAEHGQKILGFRTDEYYWRDLGKPDDLTQAAKDLAV